MTDPSIHARKQSLRREMRSMRRQLADQAERSDRMWAHVRALGAVRDAHVVMAFAAVPGEPQTAPFVEWCRARGKVVLFPEDSPPPDPAAVDVVIVPGVAFTPSGDRLGQGGGWYDRFLAGVRPSCMTIGVGFEPQLLDEIPLEDHDLRLDLIVTEAGAARPFEGSNE